MDHGDIFRRSARQDRKYRCIALEAIDARQQHPLGFFWRDCILGLPSLSLLQFKIVSRRNRAASVCHTVSENGLFRSGLATGIEEQLAMGKVVSP